MAYTSPYDPKSSEARSSWLAGLTEAMSIVTKELDLAATPEPVTITLTELPIDDENQRKIYQAQEWNKLWLTEPKPVIKKDDVEITEDNDHFTIDYLGGSIVFEDLYKPDEGAVITADVSHILGNSQGKSTILEAIQSKLETITSALEEKANDSDVNQRFEELNTAIEEKQDELTFDSVPTAESVNPVESQGIKKYVDEAVESVKGVYIEDKDNDVLYTATFYVSNGKPMMDLTKKE